MCVDDDALKQRPKELDSFEHLLLGQGVREHHLRFQGPEEFLSMGDVTNAMDVRVFHLGRTLALGELGQIGHEPLNEAFEEGHRHHDRHRRQSSDEQADVHQVAMDGLRIRIGRNGMGRNGEASHHPGMTVAHFLDRKSVV